MPEEREVFACHSQCPYFRLAGGSKSDRLIKWKCMVVREDLEIEASTDALKERIFHLYDLGTTLFMSFPCLVLVPQVFTRGIEVTIFSQDSEQE